MASNMNNKGIDANDLDKDLVGRKDNADDSDAMNVDWMIMSDFSTKIGAPTQLSSNQSPPKATAAATTAKPIVPPRATDDLEEDLEDIEWLQSLGLDEPVESYNKPSKSVTGNNLSAASTQFSQFNQSNANAEANNIENIDWLIVSDLTNRIEDSVPKTEFNRSDSISQSLDTFTNSAADDFSFLDEPELTDFDSLGFDIAKDDNEKTSGDFANEFPSDEFSQSADLSDMEFLGDLLQESSGATDDLSNDILNDLRDIEELDTIGRSFTYENEGTSDNSEISDDLLEIDNSVDSLTDNLVDEQLDLQPNSFIDSSIDGSFAQSEQALASPDLIDDWQVDPMVSENDFAVPLEVNPDVDDAIWSDSNSLLAEVGSSTDYADVFADDWQPLSDNVPLDDGVWHSSESASDAALSDTVINNAFDNPFNSSFDESLDNPFEMESGSDDEAIAFANFDFQDSLANSPNDSSTENLSTDNLNDADFAVETSSTVNDLVETSEAAEFSDRPDFENANFEIDLEQEIIQPMLEADSFEYYDEKLEPATDLGLNLDWQDNLEADANLGADADWGNNWQDNLEADANLGADADWQDNLGSSEPLEDQDYWQENLEVESIDWQNITELEQDLEQNLGQELAQDWQPQDEFKDEFKQELNDWSYPPIPEDMPLEAIAPNVSTLSDAAEPELQEPVDDYQHDYLPSQDLNLEANFEQEIDRNLEIGLEGNLESNFENILDEDFDLATFDEDSLTKAPSAYTSSVATTLTPIHKELNTPLPADDVELIANELDRDIQTKIEPIEDVEFSRNVNLDAKTLDPIDIIDISVPEPSPAFVPPPPIPPVIDSFDPIEEEIANNLLRDRQNSEASFIQDALNKDLLGDDLLGDDLLAGGMNHEYLDNFELDNLDTQLSADYGFTPPAISTGLNAPTPPPLMPPAATASMPTPPPLMPPTATASMPTPPPIAANPPNFYEEPSLSHTSATPLTPPSLPPLPPRRNTASNPSRMSLPTQSHQPKARNAPAPDSFDSFHESSGRSANPRSAKDIDSVEQGWSELLDADTVLSGVLRSPIGGDTTGGQSSRSTPRPNPDTGAARSPSPRQPQRQPQERGRSQGKKPSTGLPNFDEMGLEIHDDNTDWSGLLDSGELSDNITTISNANTPKSSRPMPPRSDMTIGGETREIPRDRRPSTPKFNDSTQARMGIPADPMDFNRFTEDNYDAYQPVTAPPAAPQKPKMAMPSISLESLWNDYLKYPVIGLGAIGGAFLLYGLVNRPIFDFGLRLGVFKDAKGMDFTKADFTGAKLENVDFSEANLTNAKFHDANLAGANLQNAKLDGTDFKNANMNGARLINASVVWANFSNAQMNLVDFSGADITRSNFTGTKMNGASLKGTKIGAQGTDKATRLSPTVLLAWQIVNEPREGRNLNGQDLSALNLSHSMLKRANLTNAKLNFTDMTETDLSGANLSGAQVNGANWNGAKLNGINLTDVKFDKTKLPRTDEQTICPNNRPGPCKF